MLFLLSKRPKRVSLSVIKMNASLAIAYDNFQGATRGKLLYPYIPRELKTVLAFLYQTTEHLSRYEV
jgi:hypothetical protein